MPAFSKKFMSIYEKMVDPNIGIVQRLIDLPLQPSEAKLFITVATCRSSSYFCTNNHSNNGYTVQANGAGFTREHSLWCTLGEACERYTSGIVIYENLIKATGKELCSSIIDMSEFITFSNKQYERSNFPYSRYNENQDILWTEGLNICTNQKVYIPASLVWMGYRAKNPREIFVPQISTGQASGLSLNQAILNGLNEVIERDAFTCAWLLKYSAPRVKLNLIEEAKIRDFDSIIGLPGLEINTVDIITDIQIPSYLTLIKSKNKDIIACGAASNFSSLQALKKSILEAHHTRNWTFKFINNLSHIRKKEIHNFDQHVAYYCQERNFKKVRFFWNGPNIDHFYNYEANELNCEDQLKETLKRVFKAGYNVYYVDTTTEDIKSLGFYTVKVLVPGLQPLHVGYGMEHLDLRRLIKVAKSWALNFSGSINHEPHPFP